MMPFRLIVITSEADLPFEVQAWEALCAEGLTHLHLRKPHWTKAQTAACLEKLSPKLRKCIHLHDHHDLAETYELGGIHLNARHTEQPARYTGCVSRSCHSLEEVWRHKSACDYVFLSPIFESISKTGYASAFTEEALRRAAEDGVLDEKVIGLGGVTVDKIKNLKAWKFGGAALLGAIWPTDSAKIDEEKAIESVMKNWEQLKTAAAAQPGATIHAPALPRLQFITHGDVVASAKAALEAGVKWVQFRCKQAESTQDLLEKAWQVRCLCHQYGAMMSVDDYVYLVDECKAEALHLGADDMPIEEARRVVGKDIIIGGTAHNMDEIRKVVAAGADYIGLGPFRYTTTKEKLSPLLGLDGYRDLLARCKAEGINLPIYAIGGIQPADAEALRETGVYGLAVSGAILQAGGIDAARAAVKQLTF